MRASRLLRFAFAMIFVLYLSAGQVHACACCANDGEYFKYFARIKDHELELIKELRFGDKAFLFSTEADPEVYARGLVNPKDEYSLSGSLVGRTWQLLFSDGPNKGTLNVPLPLKMESYKVDIRDGQKSGGGGPLLYKEWRFEGLVLGSGFFRSGFVGPTRYSLVLQGRGNSCDNAEDFSSWRLEIKGKKASYAFYGTLDKQIRSAASLVITLDYWFLKPVPEHAVQIKKRSTLRQRIKLPSFRDVLRRLNEGVPSHACKP